jgi:26S proteasome regulatory subunit (ATPase 3-interacting protein)
MAALKAERGRLTAALGAANADAARAKAARAAATSGPTPAQVGERLAAANAALPGLRAQVAALSTAGPRTTAADMAAARKKAADATAAWAKRKAMFGELWGAVSENMDRNAKTVLAEIGVETDEDAKVCLADVRALVASGQKTVGGPSKLRKM